MSSTSSAPSPVAPAAHRLANRARSRVSIAIVSALVVFAAAGYWWLNRSPGQHIADNLSRTTLSETIALPFAHKTGSFAINPQFADAAPFSEGLAFVLTDAGRIGYIDRTGKLVIPDTFESDDVSAAILAEPSLNGRSYVFRARGFSEGLASVRVGGTTGSKHGYIDKSGAMVITPQFDYASDFSEGLAVVGIGEEPNRRYGYIDKTGAFVVNPQYSFAHEFSEGRAEVAVNNKYGYIDRSGAMVVPPLSEIGNPRFSEGLVEMQIGGRRGYFDRSGRIAINPQFAGALPFSEGLAPVTFEYKTRKWGYIDRTGQVVIPEQFEMAWGFGDGLAAVVVGGRTGYIDRTGTFVINPQFDEAQSFVEGLAVVRVGDERTGRYGYIDKSGQIVVPPQFDYADPFSDGLARVRIGDAATGKWGYVWR